MPPSGLGGLHARPHQDGTWPHLHKDLTEMSRTVISQMLGSGGQLAVSAVDIDVSSCPMDPAASTG